MVSDLPSMLGSVYDFAAAAEERAAAAAAPLNSMDLLQPQLQLLPGSPWTATSSSSSSTMKAGPLLALHSLQLASALSANLLLPVENRLFLAGFPRASLGPLLLAADAAQRSSSSSSSSSSNVLAAFEYGGGGEDIEEMEDLSEGEWGDPEDDQDPANEVSIKIRNFLLRI